MVTRKTRLYTAISTVIALGTGLGAVEAIAARVEGRVSDASGSVFLAAAQVRIPELNLQAASRRDGRFSFTNVPPGTYTLIVDYVGAPRVERQLIVTGDETTNIAIAVGDTAASRIESVIVYGVASRAASALNRQRAADNLISVISADSVNRLPDNNIAEALQRAPGVSLERDQGEGRFIGIRGLAPSLNTVQINGVNVPAPDSEQRAVALDVIPSELLETLEITKTFMPEQDGDAIGGTVNVKSLSGFDRKGQYWKFSGEASYNDLQEETSPKVSGVYTNTFEFSGGEQFGIAAALSYEDREFGSENIEHDDGWVDEGEFRYPEEPEHRDYEVTRERIGAALNFDYRPSDTSSYYLRTLYSDFEDDEIRNRIEIQPNIDTVTELTQTTGAFDEAEYVRSLKDRKETQEIISVVLGGENQFDLWTVEYSVGISHAEEEEPGRIDTDFEGSDWPLSYTSLGETPRYLFAAENYDPTEFELDEMVVEDNLVEDDENSFKLDITRQLQWGDAFGEIKFGGKVRSREKDRESDILVYDDFDSVGEPDAGPFAGGNVDYDLNDFGFGLNPGALRSFRRTLTNDNLNADESLTQSTVGDYVIDEDIYAGYIQGRFDIDRLRIVTGVRYEYTDVEADGFRGAVYESETDDINTNGFERNSDDGDYDYFFPSIVLRYEWNDELILRGAASQTIARPSFGALNPSSLAEIEEEDGETELQIEDLGNLDIDPYESINLDASVEWYPGRFGILSAGFFYKDVDQFIAQVDVSDSLDLTPWLDLVGLTVDDIDDVDALQFQNGDDADLYGVEISYVKNFDNGFTVGINGTYTDSDADFKGRSVDLPESAEQIYNVILGYENYGWQARIAYNYTDERLLVIGSNSRSDVYQDSHNQIDASITYNFNDSISVFFEAINITDEPFYAFQDNSRFNWQYEEYGETYVLGLSISSF